MNQDNKIEEKDSSSGLSKQEQDVLRNLESEGVEISTDVTKVLESLTEEQRRVIVGALYAVEESSSFRGPLPPPEMLKGMKVFYLVLQKEFCQWLKNSKNTECI